jgi:hypothetical protein
MNGIMEASVQSLLRPSENLKAVLEVEVTQLQERGDLSSSSANDRSRRILAVVSHRRDYVGDEDGRCVTCFLCQWSSRRICCFHTRSGILSLAYRYFY